MASTLRSALQKAHQASHSIDPSRWEDEINSAGVDKHDLDSLVFEYLVIEGFSEAAVEFARETGLPHDIDHDMIRERMEIRAAVEEGRVEEAVRRVNELDPEILDTNPTLLFQLHLLRLIELIRVGDEEGALTFATVALAPRGAQNPEFLSDLERAMALLAFPDVARFADDSIPTEPPEPATLELLKDPAFTPIYSLMRRSQRIRIARELNVAILESQGQGMETRLGGLARLMCWGEERMEKAGVVLPPGEKDLGRKWAETVLDDVCI